MGDLSLQKENLPDGNYLLIVEHLNALAIGKNYSAKKGCASTIRNFIHFATCYKAIKGSYQLKPLQIPFRSGVIPLSLRLRLTRLLETEKVEDLLRNMQGFEAR